MSLFVPIMLFGWIPLTIYLFFFLKPHQAVIISVIGGVMFLPMVGYDLPGLPTYSKSAAISWGLLLGGRLSGRSQKSSFNWSINDLPMILWCISPFITSMTNQLGVYDGISGIYEQIVTWGIPYFAARMYFDTSDKLKELCIGILIGGLIYVPFCLYEIRMSPELSKIIYGFFPHQWLQHKRYGGWRPIVFMQHGLMVSLWMAISAITIFWLWRDRLLIKLKGIPASFVAFIMVLTALLCKSANGWITLSTGCICYYIHKRSKTNLFFLIMVLIIPSYTIFRITGFVSAQSIESRVEKIFDAERSGSLGVRLLQEDLFIQRAMERPLFGWGGYSRGWPVDPISGKLLIEMVDALWIINFSKYGFFGLFSFLIGMLIGPWLALRRKKKQGLDGAQSGLEPKLLSLVVVLFMIDCFVNGMVNTVYIMISGALATWALNEEKADKNNHIHNKKLGPVQ